MWRFELRATPATSPRYRSGGILITSCTSNGISGGGADGCCAPRLTPRPASRTNSAFFTRTSSPERARDGNVGGILLQEGHSRGTRRVRLEPDQSQKEKGRPKRR